MLGGGRVSFLCFIALACFVTREEGYRSQHTVLQWPCPAPQRCPQAQECWPSASRPLWSWWCWPCWQKRNPSSQATSNPYQSIQLFFSTSCVLINCSSAVLEVSDPKQAHRLRSARSSCSFGRHATRSETDAAKRVTRNGFAARRRKDKKSEADVAASRATTVLI